MRRIASTDLSVFPLCLGSNVFGWTVDERTSFAVLDAYAAGGGNFIDTADVYSEWNGTPGISETIIGNWMKARGNRDQMVIATKVSKLSTRPGLSASNIRAAANESLQRLQTDHIDLYYSHADDDTITLEETLGAFDALVKEGKVRHLAASNFSASRLSESLKVSEREGLARYVALQPEYNMVTRDFEDELQPLVQAESIATIPYYALANGFLSGKYTRSNSNPADTKRAHRVQPYLNERGFALVDTLQSIASAHSVPVASVSLAWLAAQPTVSAPISSARSVQQVQELLPMATVQLTKDEISALTDSY